MKELNGADKNEIRLFMCMQLLLFFYPLYQLFFCSIAGGIISAVIYVAAIYVIIQYPVFGLIAYGCYVALCIYAVKHMDDEKGISTASLLDSLFQEKYRENLVQSESEIPACPSINDPDAVKKYDLFFNLSHPEKGEKSSDLLAREDLPEEEEKSEELTSVVDEKCKRFTDLMKIRAKAF